MKSLVKVVGVLVALFLVLVIAAPFLIPTDTLFTKVSEEVETTTGRTLTLAGDKNLSVFPSLTLELNDVRFSNMQGGTRPEMATMEQLEVHIPWLALLGGEMKLEKFVIREPDILLETDANGKGNWELFAATNDQQVQVEGDTQVKLPEGFDIELGEVAVYGGKFVYRDGKTGAEQVISDLDLQVLLPSLRKPLEIKGGVTYMAERFELTAVLDNPVKAIEGTPFSVMSNVTSRLANLAFEGGIAAQGKEVNGEFALAGPSLKQITKWQGIALNAKDEAFNAFNISGQLSFGNNQLLLKGFNARLDELDIKGESTLLLGSRLAVNGDIDLGMLDLNPYLPEPASSTEQPSSSGDAAAEPIVWDETAMDLSGLNVLDASLSIRSTGLKAREIKLGENQFSVKLQRGVATLNMDKFNAYQGNGAGQVKVSASARPYKITTRFDLSGIDAQPLLTDVAGFEKLMGTGSLNWDLNTTGVSQKDFVSALAGKLAFNFADGAVKGANIAEMVRKAKEMLSGNLGAVKEGLNSDFDNAAKTDFSALSGSFVFNKGIGTNSDLKMLSPLIRVSGDGSVNLPDTLVDYRLVTGIVDSIEGQGAQDSSTGFKIPVRIKGPFHDVKTSIDVKDAAKDELKEKAKDKLKDKLKGIFGG